MSDDRSALVVVVYVRGQVLGQVIGPGEALAAHLAVVRPLAGVDAQVPGQVAFAAERAAAEQARERPFAGVLADVQLQILLGPDALAAERTRERFPVPSAGVVVIVSGGDSGHRGGGSGRRGFRDCRCGGRPLSVRPEYVEQRRRGRRRGYGCVAGRLLSCGRRRRLGRRRGHHLVRAGHLTVGRRGRRR